ncbi:MAG: hypothetical protein OQJ89_01700 [Kangiellaceae bacterium]|nr:hypothetical protein [Kangiellaceae bacterium]MCW9015657.1 hypothetical protein [Kangiellaceae bacterium]
MPLSPVGIVHTVVGMLALFFGVKALWQYKQISFSSVSGKIYLGATVFTAATALTIFKHGGFNAAHGLAILTLLAVVIGLILEKTVVFKSWNKYFVNLCFSSTFLFHLIPTATEILTRFPQDAPLVSSLKDPLLQKTFLAIFIVFVIFLIIQMNWLRNQK